jgi:serine/threonine protein kinase
VTFLHTKDIIHSRIYPSNILLTRDCQLKLTGFDFAHFSFELRTNYLKVTLREDENAIQPKWTPPNYSSPEFLLDKFHGYSFAMDSWSIGCVFAELLIGRVLFVATHGGWLDILFNIFKVFGFPSSPLQRKINTEIEQELGMKFPPRAIESLQRQCPEEGKNFYEFLLERKRSPLNQNNNNNNNNNNNHNNGMEEGNDEGDDYLNPRAVHLLENLLLVNPKFRISPEAALSHPFFADAETPFPYSHDYHDASFSPIVDRHNNNSKQRVEELFQFVNEESFSEQEMIELLESENS